MPGNLTSDVNSEINAVFRESTTGATSAVRCHQLNSTRDYL